MIDTDSFFLLNDQDLIVLERIWNKIENNFRKEHSEITDEDVSYKYGEFNLMTYRIAIRTNRTSAQVLHEIRAWGEFEHSII